MFSIIIPVHNQIEMTLNCIESIEDNTKDFEIIIVDNGSDPRCPKYCDTLIRNEENLGFPVAVNQGIEASNGDVVVILNNDVIVTHHWLEKLQWHLSSGFDMVGPCTNSVSGPQQVLIGQYNNGQELNTAAMEFQVKNAFQSTPFHRLVFYCVAIKREVIDKVGLLDEVYTPGNYEDDDFCMRAIEAGFKLGIAQDCYVHHFGGVTHKALNLNYQELIAKNHKIFTDKWGSRYDEMVKKNNIWKGSEIVFTGERAIPEDVNTPADIMSEHWARYKYATSFVKGKRVLDVACGAGYGADLLAETAHSVIGGDISPETIKYCKSHYTKPVFSIFDICEIPYPGSSFDVVVSFETIEHITDGEKFLSEIIRVLDSCGTLLISCPLGGECGNIYHKAYYQRGTFEPFLKKYFDNVKILYQRKDEFFNESKSPEHCDTFTGEYALAICTKPKKDSHENK